MKPANLRALVLLVATALLVAPYAVLAHGGGGGGAKVRQSLTRPEPVVNPEVEGRLEIRSSDDRQEFKLRVKRADKLVDHELWIENGSAVMEFVAAFQTGASSLRFRARLRNGEGSLPLGVSLLDELAGRHLEIRIRGSGDVVLATDIPDLTPRRDAKAEDDLDATPDAPAGAEAEIRVRSRPRKGDERFRVKVHDFVLAPTQKLRLFLEDPMNPNVLVDQGALQDDDSDEAEFRARTRKGQALPFGVASTRNLVGLKLEIRDADTGTVYFEGMVPALD